MTQLHRVKLTLVKMFFPSQRITHCRQQIYKKNVCVCVAVDNSLNTFIKNPFFFKRFQMVKYAVHLAYAVHYPVEYALYNPYAVYNLIITRSDAWQTAFLTRI